MNLSELLVNNRLPEGFNAKGYGLVFGESVKDAIDAAHPPDAKHRIAPVPTADGRYACCADVLTEAIGGILDQVFKSIDWSLAIGVEVLDWSEVVELLPKPEPEQLEGLEASQQVINTTAEEVLEEPVVEEVVVNEPVVEEAVVEEVVVDEPVVE